MATAIYNTPCLPWPGPTGGFIDFFPNTYIPFNQDVLIPPFPLEILIGQIFVTSTSKQYTIDFASPPPFVAHQHVNVFMNFTGTTYQSSTIVTDPSLEVVVLPGPSNTGQQYDGQFDIQCTCHLGRQQDLPNNSFDEGDVYTISVDKTCTNKPGVQILFTRKVAFNLSTIEQDGIATTTILSNNVTNNNCCPTLSPCNLINIPIIDIQGQTTYNGQNLSDMTFTIQDKYQYYCYDKNIIKVKH